MAGQSGHELSIYFLGWPRWAGVASSGPAHRGFLRRNFPNRQIA